MKRRLARVAAITLVCVFAATPALARHQKNKNTHHHNAAVMDANGNGVVRSHKTGATAHVSASVAAKFQGYIDDLEAEGATVRFMGGYRPGHCSPRHMHSCNLALDVCQLRRGIVDSRCNLPSPTRAAEIADRHGLFEGGQWCDSDYGHAQAGVSSPACGSTLAARRTRHRYARR